MNASLMTLEICVMALGVALMLADFWMPPDRKKFAGYAAVAALAGLLVVSLSGYGTCTMTGTAFNGMFVEDALAIFFKRFVTLFWFGKTAIQIPGLCSFLPAS